MAPIKAPDSGVRIRMYRQGHGDCFLLTMRKADGDPFHILIDCGFKPGSEIKKPVEDVIKDIVDATGGHLDVLMITHEHQDHVNLFTAKLNGTPMFDEIDKVDTLWLGWTADPDDKIADEIRKGHAKAVRLLLDAQTRLARRFGSDFAPLVSQMLAFEGFGAAEPQGISQAKMARSVAEAMRYVTGKVPEKKKRKYFKPHETTDIQGVPGVRVVALGPPRSRSELNKDEPKSAEEIGRVYEKEHGLNFGFGFGLGGLLAAGEENGNGDVDAYHPFADTLRLKRGSQAWRKDKRSAAFLNQFYPAKDNWRDIQKDWLFALDWFARKINVEVNNSSLVIAIQLAKSGKVLLFAGDAQYGNWMSWDDRPIKFDDGSTTTTRELLKNTVLYKVGHHGSHNATLKDDGRGDYPNLGWMAHDQYRDEFVAMIPANEPWALDLKPDPWVHPLPTIRRALDELAEGRVFQSNIDFKDMKKSKDGAKERWSQFLKRAKGSEGQDLYFDYWIPDE